MKEIFGFVFVTVLSAFLGAFVGGWVVKSGNNGALSACYQKYYSLIYTKPISFEVTAYTERPEETTPTSKGKTATGLQLTWEHRWKIVACDWNFWEPGQKFLLLGNGFSYWAECQDSGGKIRGRNRLDLYVGDLKQARKFGVKKLIGIPLNGRIETNGKGAEEESCLSGVHENVV